MSLVEADIAGKRGICRFSHFPTLSLLEANIAGKNIIFIFVKTAGMLVSEITLFNTLKSKLGEVEAQAVVEGIKNAVAEEFLNKKDILSTKMDIEKLKAELLVLKWMLGFVLAGILSLIIKSFF